MQKTDFELATIKYETLRRRIYSGKVVVDRIVMQRLLREDEFLAANSKLSRRVTAAIERRLDNQRGLKDIFKDAVEDPAAGFTTMIPDSYIPEFVRLMLNNIGTGNYWFRKHIGYTPDRSAALSNTSQDKIRVTNDLTECTLMLLDNLQIRRSKAHVGDSYFGTRTTFIEIYKEVQPDTIETWQKEYCTVVLFSGKQPEGMDPSDILPTTSEDLSDFLEDIWSRVMSTVSVEPLSRSDLESLKRSAVYCFSGGLDQFNVPYNGHLCRSPLKLTCARWQPLEEEWINCIPLYLYNKARFKALTEKLDNSRRKKVWNDFITLAESITNDTGNTIILEEIGKIAAPKTLDANTLMYTIRAECQRHTECSELCRFWNDGCIFSEGRKPAEWKPGTHGKGENIPLVGLKK